MGTNGKRAAAGASLRPREGLRPMIRWLSLKNCPQSVLCAVAKSSQFLRRGHCEFRLTEHHEPLGLPGDRWRSGCRAWAEIPGDGCSSLSSHNWEPICGRRHFYPIRSHRFLRLVSCKCVLTVVSCLFRPGKGLRGAMSRIWNGQAAQQRRRSVGSRPSGSGLWGLFFPEAHVCLHL